MTTITAILPAFNEEISIGSIILRSQYLNGKDLNIPLYRRVGRKVLDTFSNINSGLDITEIHSGFRAYASHIPHAFRFRQNGFGIESEMLTDAANAGLNIPWVECGVQDQMPIQPVIELNCMQYKPMSLKVKSSWVGLT